MKTILICSVLLTFASLTGCVDSPDGGGDPAKAEADRTDNAEKSEGGPGSVSVKLPGVEINIDEKTGVEVKAPGTDVSVRKDGIDVTAPNVDIKAGPGKRSEE